MLAVSIDSIPRLSSELQQRIEAGLPLACLDFRLIGSLPVEREHRFSRFNALPKATVFTADISELRRF